MATESSVTSGVKQGLSLGIVGWVLLGLVLWLVFALRQVPATWGAYAMTQSGQLALSGVTGTLWHGRASLTSFKVDGHDYALGQLEWKLEPWTLLTLKPCARLQTRQERQEIDGRVCAGLSGDLRLENTSINLPANVLRNLPLQVDGQVFAQIEQMQVRGDFLQSLTGKMSWTNARIHNGRHWMPLGGYGANLRDDGQGGIQLNTFHLDGPTEVELDIHLAAGGGGSARGNLSMTREFMNEVQADAWIAMVTSGSETDAQGKTRYRVELEF